MLFHAFHTIFFFFWVEYRNQTVCSYHDKQLACNASKSKGLKVVPRRWWVPMLALPLMLKLCFMFQQIPYFCQSLFPNPDLYSIIIFSVQKGYENRQHLYCLVKLKLKPLSPSSSILIKAKSLQVQISKLIGRHTFHTLAQNAKSFQYCKHTSNKSLLLTLVT